MYPDPYAVDQRDIYYPTEGELRFQVKPVENGYLVLVTTGKSITTYIAAEFKDVHDIIDLAAVKQKLNTSG
jgi:negative regulator of genetic competence, sporulation and motility